jgi:GNAT superfamily N-acetyltransferase
MENFEKKKGKPEHFEKILAIAAEGNLFIYPKILFSILSLFGWLYVGIKDEKVVGYFCYIALPIVNRAFLLQIGIEKKSRGQGMGTQFLEMFCDHVKTEHKITTVLAHTLKPRVVKLLQRQSWKIILDILGVIFVRKNSIR